LPSVFSFPPFPSLVTPRSLASLLLSKEVEVMAEMRAFYSYSALRYVEVIIQLVETGLLSEFGGLKTKMQQEFRYYDVNLGKLNHEPWMLTT
jgi:hypothetical protein